SRCVNPVGIFRPSRLLFRQRAAPGGRRREERAVRNDSDGGGPPGRQVPAAARRHQGATRQGGRRRRVGRVLNSLQKETSASGRDAEEVWQAGFGHHLRQHGRGGRERRGPEVLETTKRGVRQLSTG